MVQGVVIENGHIVDTNPATGAVIQCVRVSTPSEIDAAVAAARTAQPAWNAQSLEERTELVKKACSALAGKRQQLAKLITSEMGKTLSESLEEVDDNVDMSAYCDLVAQANAPEVDGGSLIVRHPHGVVAVCAPWNYPVEEIVLLCVPALIAGNAVVVKPSEVVPLSSGLVVETLRDALPDGLVNLLQGDGDVGAKLTGHALVDMVGFTGSTATGQKILNTASKTLKPVVLECGGKDPMVVLDDADLDLAAHDAVAYSLANCGQVCCAVERVYVAASVAEDFESKVKAEASKWKVGDGVDPDTNIGPMASRMQRDIVHSHVQKAKQAGARCVLGGELPGSSERGNYYPATVLADVPHGALRDEETFGPVVALSTFDGSDDTAVALANDSRYGLTASVYSSDLKRAGAVAARLAAGQVGVNTNPLSGVRSIRCPFVGHKESGYGTHSGFDGWRQFSTPKSLIYAEAPADDAVPAVAKRDRCGPAVPPVAALLAFGAGVLITLAATRR